MFKAIDGNASRSPNPVITPIIDLAQKCEASIVSASGRKDQDRKEKEEQERKQTCFTRKHIACAFCF